jgi:hypothetical protein
MKNFHSEGNDMKVCCQKISLLILGILGCLFFYYTLAIPIQENFLPANLDVELQYMSDGSPVVGSFVSTTRYINFPHNHLGFTDSSGKIAIKFQDAYNLQKDNSLHDNNMLLWIELVDNELFYGIPLQPIFANRFNRKRIIDMPKLTNTKIQIKSSDNDIDFASLIFVFWRNADSNYFISRSFCGSDGDLSVKIIGKENCSYVVLKKCTSSGYYFCTKILEYQFLQKEINAENFDYRFSLSQEINDKSWQISPARYCSNGTFLSPFFEFSDIGFGLHVMLDITINPTINNDDHHILYNKSENILGILTLFSDGRYSRIEYDYPINRNDQTSIQDNNESSNR